MTVLKNLNFNMQAQINGTVKQINYYIAVSNIYLPKTMAKIVVLLVSFIIICSSFQVSKVLNFAVDKYKSGLQS